MTDLANRLDYVDRVNRAVDYIVVHLSEPLDLDVVASVASFSPFHFHRVFGSVMGETLGQFIKRLRLERAVSIMTHGHKRTLLEIAHCCGFDSSSDFSRCFKKKYGIPPSTFDLETFQSESRSQWQQAVASASGDYRLSELPEGENPDGFKAAVRSLPPRQVAYRRVLDPYRPNVVNEAIYSMLAWAEARGIAGGQWLGYMWDNPDIVPYAKCRYDIGLEVNELFDEEGIGYFEFPSMLVVEVEVRGGVDLELRALDWIYGTWLPRSGYVPAEHPSFEAWLGRPLAQGEAHFELMAQVPVTRLD